MIVIVIKITSERRYKQSSQNARPDQFLPGKGPKIEF